MDLSSLENKLKEMSSGPFSPTSQAHSDSFLSQQSTHINTHTNTQSTHNSTQSTHAKTQSNTNTIHPPADLPVSITKKINDVSDEDVASYSSKVIPNWKDLQKIYQGRWDKEKEKFQTQLKANFARLVERYASGKQELFQLCAPERRERLFIEAFLELFESGYAPHVGDVERIANKRVRKLYITLPNNYSSIY